MRSIPKVDFRLRPPYGELTEQTGMWESVAGRDDVVTPRSLREESMDALIEEMDRAGIEYGVALGRRTPAGEHGATGRVSNEDLAELQDEYGDRFVGFAGVDPDEDGAVEEVERAVSDLGLQGVSLDPGKYDPPRTMDDESLHPVYERCADLGVPVSVTLSLIAVPDVSYLRQVTIERAAAAFPDLQFVIAHAAWPRSVEALALAAHYDNIWIGPDIYLNTPNPGRGRFLADLQDGVADRVLWGSAYPYYPLVESVDGFAELDIPEHVARKVCSETPRALLGL